MTRTTVALAFAATLAGRSAGAREPAAPAWRTRLDEAMNRAAGQNPDLQAMEARIVAARHRVPQTIAFPDPEIELGIKDVPPSDLSLTRDDFTMEMVTARQRFPGSGKRAAARDVASADLESLVAEHDRHLAMVRADVADVFFQLAALDRRLAILEETKARRWLRSRPSECFPFSPVRPPRLRKEHSCADRSPGP